MPTAAQGQDLSTKQLVPIDPCAALRTLSRNRLKRELLVRFSTVVDQVNRDFGNNPALAMQVVSEQEVNGIGFVFGERKEEQGERMSQPWFPVLYRHILERLIASRWAQHDPCLPAHVTYVPHPLPAGPQTRADTANFRGKGAAKGLLFDVRATGDRARKKRKNVTVVTYERLLNLGSDGVVAKATSSRVRAHRVRTLAPP